MVSVLRSNGELCWVPRLGPACMHVPTSDTPLMAKTGQAETSC